MNLNLQFIEITFYIFSIKNEFFAALEITMKIKQHNVVFNATQIILKYSKLNEVKVMPDSFLDLIYKKMCKFILSQKEFLFNGK